jgi:hypothetical protein
MSGAASACRRLRLEGESAETETQKIIMPVNIASIPPGSLESRLDAFRKTIPAGQGYTTSELEQMDSINATAGRIRNLIARRKWGVRLQIGVSLTWILLNPRDLKKYADKN